MDLSHAHDGRQLDRSERSRLRPIPAGGMVVDGATDRSLAEAELVDLVGAHDRLVAATHHGFGYRSPNEDRVAVVEVDDRGGVRSGFFVVDGMGGYAGGDVSAQTLAEELVDTYGMRHEHFRARSRQLLLTRVLATLDRCRAPQLVAAVAEDLHLRILDPAAAPGPEHVLAAVRELVQSRSVAVPCLSSEQLEAIARTIRELAELAIPDRCEVALFSTRARLAHYSAHGRPPDACFVGAVIHTSPDGSRWLDVKQVGDCRLFVTDSNGGIKFRSINDSMIPEPNLLSPDLTLADLMTYSLHRNVVSSSLNTATTAKRYRRTDVPFEVAAGDVVYLYSDGCDDLFTPEEIVALAASAGPARFLRGLLEVSEKRMRYVHRLIHTDQARRKPDEWRAAYPSVHHMLNAARIADGYYVEPYEDGTAGRWLKPPKCDNFAACVIRVGAAPDQGERVDR